MKNLIKAMLLAGIAHTSMEAQTVKGFNHIESVAADGRFLFVADIGPALTPDAKDGDGKVLKLDAKGNILDADFAKEKLDAPKGLAVYKGILFVTDIDRIVALDMKTGATLYQIDFSKDSHFLNDIAVWDTNTLYVSATDVSKLYKVNLHDKTYTEVVLDKPIAGINGLFCHKKGSLLYVNGLGVNGKANGVVGYINLKNNSFTPLTMAEGIYDGLHVANDVLYTSNWVDYQKKGILLTIQLSSRRVNRVPMEAPIAGPADFVIDGSYIIVPAMISGELHFLPYQNLLTQKF